MILGFLKALGPYILLFLYSYKNAKIQLYNYKNEQVGTVNLPSTISVPPRDTKVIYYSAAVTPTIKEAHAIARNCRDNNGHTQIRMEASVEQVVGAVSTKKNLGHGTQMVKCKTPPDIITQLSKIGRADGKKGKSPAYGTVIEGIGNQLSGKKPADGADAPKADADAPKADAPKADADAPKADAAPAAPKKAAADADAPAAPAAPKALKPAKKPVAAADAAAAPAADADAPKVLKKKPKADAAAAAPEAPVDVVVDPVAAPVAAVAGAVDQVVAGAQQVAQQAQDAADGNIKKLKMKPKMKKPLVAPAADADAPEQGAQ